MPDTVAVKGDASGPDVVMPSPGPRSERNGAELEKEATPSPDPEPVVAPTLTADETHAGSAIANGWLLLPDAITVATPTFRNRSIGDL